jgi:hypothetical protein
MTDADPKSWREHVTNIKKTWVKHPWYKIAHV